MANTEPDPQPGQPATRSAIPSFDEFINSEQVAVAVGLFQRAMSEMQERSERMSRRWLHAWNIPAGSDLNRIVEHLDAMERQVELLTERLEEKEKENRELRKKVRSLSGDSAPAPAKKAAKSKSAS